MAQKNQSLTEAQSTQRKPLNAFMFYAFLCVLCASTMKLYRAGSAKSPPPPKKWILQKPFYAILAMQLELPLPDFRVSNQAVLVVSGEIGFSFLG